MGFFDSKQTTTIKRVPAGVGLVGARKLGGGMTKFVLGELERGADMPKAEQQDLFMQGEETLRGARRGMEMKAKSQVARKGGAGSGIALASQARIGEAVMRARLQMRINTKLAILNFRESRASRLAGMATGAYQAVEQARAAGQVSKTTSKGKPSGMDTMMGVATTAARAYLAFQTMGMSEAAMSKSGEGGFFGVGG